MIRALAIGDVKVSDWYKLIGKEFIISFLLGVTMAAGVAAIASFRAPEIILVVALSMLLIVMTGSLIGLLLPFLFTKFRLTGYGQCSVDYFYCRYLRSVDLLLHCFLDHVTEAARCCLT